MNNAEFVAATSRLEHYFDKEYKPEQLKIMFDSLKGWTIEKYKKAVNYCVRNCKYLPKIADLTNADIEYVQVKNKINIDFNNFLFIKISLNRFSLIIISQLFNIVNIKQRFYKNKTKNGYNSCSDKGNVYQHGKGAVCFFLFTLAQELSHQCTSARSQHKAQ